MALAALATGPAAAQGAWKKFRCGNGDHGQVQFPYPGNVMVQFRSETVSLKQVSNGEAKYYNGDWVLEIVGSARNLSLEVPDYGQVSCYLLNQARAPSVQPEQSVNNSGVGFPVPARALGGNMRAGPGLNYRVVGNLPEGTAIQIYRRTNHMLSGYPWFEIIYEDRGAFMLGSLICGLGHKIPGTYRVCR